MNQRIYNFRPSPLAPRLQARQSLLAAGIDESTPLPWRANRNIFKHALDQGKAGTCALNATARAFAFALYEADDTSDFQASRLFLYNLARVKEGTFPQDAGCCFSDIMQIARTVGVCPESLCPYSDTDINPELTPEMFTEAEKHQVLQSASIQTGSIWQMAHSISEGKPFICGIPIFESFESREVAETGIVPMPNPATEKYLGGHGVYFDEWLNNDDPDKALFGGWNSWGDGWGQGGRFYVPAEFLRQGATDIQSIEAVEVAA